MRKLAVKLGIALAAVASISIAAPASAAAAPLCVGTAQTAGVCVWVDPSGQTLFADCVYTGGPQCTYVYVNGPDWDCYGWIGPNTAFVCA